MTQPIRLTDGYVTLTLNTGDENTHTVHSGGNFLSINNQSMEFDENTNSYALINASTDAYIFFSNNSFTYASNGNVSQSQSGSYKNLVVEDKILKISNVLQSNNPHTLNITDSNGNLFTVPLTSNYLTLLQQSASE